jgi:hypothetical protein
LLQKSAANQAVYGPSVGGRKMLERKHRFLESKSNKARGQESDFKLAALRR